MDAELSDRTPEEIVADILNTVAVPSGEAEADVSRAVADGGAADDLEFHE